MKKLKYILTVLTVLISLLMCFDEGFSSCMRADATQLPLQPDSSGISHHHHLAEYFFQIVSVSNPDFKPSAGLRLLLKDQSFADYYIPSIWQPPKTT